VRGSASLPRLRMRILEDGCRFVPPSRRRVRDLVEKSPQPTSQGELRPQERGVWPWELVLVYRGLVSLLHIKTTTPLLIGRRPQDLAAVAQDEAAGVGREVGHHVAEEATYREGFRLVSLLEPKPVLLAVEQMKGFSPQVENVKTFCWSLNQTKRQLHDFQ